jgi:ComF family protein
MLGNRQGHRHFPAEMARALVRHALPDCCVFCGSDALGYFCFNCRCDLPRIANPCGRCDQPARVPAHEDIARDVVCAACQLRPPPFQRARSALLYAFPVDAALKSFKFGHALYYVPAFAELLLAEFLLSFQHADALVPVPLHHWRYATRGFNQAVELCKPLCHYTGLPIVRNARRIRWTPPQSGLDALSRRRNLRNAFAVKGRLSSRRPLIIDDVMTTGETCRQLARTLLEAGAATVDVLTVARAVGVTAPAG